ncbi:MAG: hypothetical protein V1848_03155 [Candidatus Magasanikbacteria bacterium]
MAQNGIKIPVKKSDGTTVFMTLQEFQEYRKSQEKQAKPSEVIVAPKEPLKPVLLVEEKTKEMIVEPEVSLSTTTPVKEIFVNEAIATKKAIGPKWDKEDFVSLLDEGLKELEEKEKKEAGIDVKLPECNEIISRMTFPIPSQLQGRFCSLVHTRLKGVRDNEQLREYAMKTEVEGGIGLNPAQVSEVVHYIEAFGKGKPMPVAEKKKEVSSGKRDVVAEILRKDMGDYQFPMGNYGRKAIVQDVKPMPKAEKRGVGPVDELGTFALVDLRRLGNTPEVSSLALKGKFMALRNESYLLYMQALEAWHASPLFREYQKAILGSLKDGIPCVQYFSQTEADKNTINLNEFISLVKLNGELNY